MYGIVNKALQEMVCAEYGSETWQKILLKAGMMEGKHSAVPQQFFD
ncbi:MAG: heme NO-binding domain-containing protein [Burkholderiales bacterium]|nr:heme NO-binding domain-containing protein [Burkholderiales bacterium]